MRKIIKRVAAGKQSAEKISEYQKYNALAQQAKAGYYEWQAQSDKLRDDLTTRAAELDRREAELKAREVLISESLLRSELDIQENIDRLAAEMADVLKRKEAAELAAKEAGAVEMDCNERAYRANLSLEDVLKKLTTAQKNLAAVDDQVVSAQKELTKVKNQIEKLNQEFLEKQKDMEGYGRRKKDLDIYARRIQKFYVEAGFGHIKI